jgi:hypothetical protein
MDVLLQLGQSSLDSQSRRAKIKADDANHYSDGGLDLLCRKIWPFTATFVFVRFYTNA